MIAYGCTDIGRVRPINQDTFFVSEKPIGGLSNLFLVADGMGGHKAGDYASRYLKEHFVEKISASSDTRPIAVLSRAIRECNRELFMLSQNEENLQGMGTTLVAATVVNSTLCAANVGDSRLYLIDRRGISQITKDHSYVEALVDRGQMTRGSAEYERRKNIITRAVGVDRNVAADFFEVPLGSGDYFLLCSDGLSNMISNRDMLRIIRVGGTVRSMVEQMISLANSRGGRDNISAVLVRNTASEVKGDEA
ncbi:Stp1/IreP family PP2C-type Ser/Thr phosphatase [Clostridium vitabionis]|jgi:serine/threonine protein phosphatase PrpC|uniref:Stp1/IreP family PP2C-type Ser/Thr phosphatase n=1 Tax=Clostridium vitabionis TaxID=2784388 RepID=UPI00188B877A|nr:Stp1/IreP family PP2C-type Ser/Thr phosphatase [Clostridium vitabionis]